MTPPRLLLGTRNLAKQRRLRWLVEGFSFDVVTPDALGSDGEPDETAPTHLETAEQKAIHWSRVSGHLALASDGGLAVPALGDRWNSLRTRRAAGEAVDDRQRADHLLALAHDLRGNDRAALRIEAAAIAREGSSVWSRQAERPIGVLVEQYDHAQISGGFWLPALIYLPSYDKTFAELSATEIDQIDDPWNDLRRHVQPFLDRLVSP